MHHRFTLVPLLALALTPVVSRNGAKLTGKAKIPASFIRDQGTGVDDGTSGYAHHPVVDPAGILYFVDGRTRQIKRVDTGTLP